MFIYNFTGKTQNHAHFVKCTIILVSMNQYIIFSQRSEFLLCTENTFIFWIFRQRQTSKVYLAESEGEAKNQRGELHFRKMFTRHLKRIVLTTTHLSHISLGANSFKTLLQIS